MSRKATEKGKRREIWKINKIDLKKAIGKVGHKARKAACIMLVHS